jgi:hypothetical protein
MLGLTMCDIEIFGMKSKSLCLVGPKTMWDMEMFGITMLYKENVRHDFYG